MFRKGSRLLTIYYPCRLLFNYLLPYISTALMRNNGIRAVLFFYCRVARMLAPIPLISRK